MPIQNIKASVRIYRVGDEKQNYWATAGVKQIQDCLCAGSSCRSPGNVTLNFGIKTLKVNVFGQMSRLRHT